MNSRTQANEIVGRESELAALSDALRAAADGRGGIMALVGDPGIGKTRLAEAAACFSSSWRSRVRVFCFSVRNWMRCHSRSRGSPAVFMSASACSDCATATGACSRFVDRGIWVVM